MRKWTAIGLACTVLLLALAGCASDDPPASSSPSPSGPRTATRATNSFVASTHPAGEDPNHVDLHDHTFNPLNLQVKAGTEVSFLNAGAENHTVTIHHKADAFEVWLKDVTLVSGASTTFTFDRVGTYHVWCRFHGQMDSGMQMGVNVS